MKFKQHHGQNLTTLMDDITTIQNSLDLTLREFKNDLGESIERVSNMYIELDDEDDNIYINIISDMSRVEENKLDKKPPFIFSNNQCLVSANLNFDTRLFKIDTEQCTKYKLTADLDKFIDALNERLLSKRRGLDHYFIKSFYN